MERVSVWITIDLMAVEKKEVVIKGRIMVMRPADLVHLGRCDLAETSFHGTFSLSDAAICCLHMLECKSNAWLAKLLGRLSTCFIWTPCHMQIPFI